MFNKSKVPIQTTNEYINLADVRGSFLYTKDNYMFQFLKVQPISTALMTDDEKQRLVERMTAEISPICVPFKITFLSRPTDVKVIIDYYERVKSMTTNSKKRDNLTKMIKYFDKMSTSESVLERQTFISIWMNKKDFADDDLFSKTNEFKNALNNTGVTASICTETEIINMLSLFYNPIYSPNTIFDVTPNCTFMEEKTHG